MATSCLCPWEKLLPPAETSVVKVIVTLVAPVDRRDDIPGVSAPSACPFSASSLIKAFKR
jgi:hypothetical protein